MLSALPSDLATISSQDCKQLTRKVTKGEIFNTLKSLAPGKSPGPDSFNIEFYLFFWVDIQDDIFNAINYFFDNARMPNSWGLTSIALIPKKR